MSLVRNERLPHTHRRECKRERESKRRDTCAHATGSLVVEFEGSRVVVVVRVVRVLVGVSLTACVRERQ